MDPREIVRNNRYIGPASFSVDLLYINQLPTTNWGVPTGQEFVVTLSPQVGEGAGQILFSADEPEARARAEALKRRLRRELMGDLASEFATVHDQLLRELAS